MSVPLALRWARPTTSIDLLWRPFLNPDRPVLIVLATSTNLLYIPNHDKWMPFRPGAMIPASDIDVLTAPYVGTGGALGAALFAEQLASRGQRFSVRFGNDVSFADLKQSPAVLVGTTRWTQELTRPLRFHIQMVGDKLMLVDAQKPDRDWVIPLRQTAGTVRGLCFSNPVIAVRIRTRGADRSREWTPAIRRPRSSFFRRSNSFDLFARSAPRGWETKNFQVVLRNTIHGNSPGSLTVLASHVW